MIGTNALFGVLLSQPAFSGRPSYRITYGHGRPDEHTFDNPLKYLRCRKTTNMQAHAMLKASLAVAFSATQDTSLLFKAANHFHFPVNEVKETNLDFINWGDTQLVYLATITLADNRTYKFVLMVNQPHTILGTVKREFNTLRRVGELRDTNVVIPFAYLRTDTYEMYATPYIEKARCIFSGKGYPWGNFNPHPYYHFEEFSEPTKLTVTSGMVALLVAYYDNNSNQGLAETHLSGDDFILTQAFRPNDPASVLSNMKLTAARGVINISFEDYLEQLRVEFIKGTHYTDSEVLQGKFRINHKSGLALSASEIEEGIRLGIELRAANAIA